MQGLEFQKVSNALDYEISRTVDSIIQKCRPPIFKYISLEIFLAALMNEVYSVSKIFRKKSGSISENPKCCSLFFCRFVPGCRLRRRRWWRGGHSARRTRRRIRRLGRRWGEQQGWGGGWVRGVGHELLLLFREPAEDHLRFGRKHRRDHLMKKCQKTNQKSIFSFYFCYLLKILKQKNAIKFKKFRFMKKIRRNSLFRFFENENKNDFCIIYS